MREFRSSIEISAIELALIALVLFGLIALAIAPGAFGQERKGDAFVTRGSEVIEQTRVLQGVVSVLSVSGQRERLPGATLNLTGADKSQPSRRAVTNDQGEYKFTGLQAGTYSLKVELTGFKEHTETVTIQTEVTILESSLEIADVSSQVTVVAGGDGLNTTDIAPSTSIGQQKLQTLPLVNERFQDALPMVPGVVRGPDGQLNLKGSRASQSSMVVNSSNVGDPFTGESSINLPLEAIESVEVVTNPYAAEYGQFTGAVTAVQTKSGSDKFQADAQSFFPRFRRRGGSFVGIEAFTPRVTFSGPIKKDKLRFFQSVEYRYVRTPVDNLPPLKRDTGLESFDSVSQLDWEVNDKNHLTATFSLFPQKLRYVGLNTFNEQEVTPNFKQRGFLLAVNERRVINGRSMLETTFSVKQFDADVFPSSGVAPMNFAPDANSGNFFNQQARRSKQYTAIETYSFSPPDFAGAHTMKLGGGFSHITFDGSNISSTVRVLRADGTRSQQIDFLGGGQLKRHKTEGFVYFQDKWSINRQLTLEYGVRYDRDNLAGENNFAPRISFAFVPIVDGRTVVRGGIGLFYDQVDLNVATFLQQQDRVLTRFGPDGETGIGTTPQRLVQPGELRTPRSINWNIELDREWLKNLFVRVGYQQRQVRREFIVDPGDSATHGSVIELSNSGQSRYRELQVTARYRFRETDEFIASYARSSAEGDLNDFNSYFGNFENPIIRANERSRLPWDAPNRFIFRGEFHVRYRLTLAPVLEMRNGFPYSIIDQDRNFISTRNRAGRYPNFVSLDLLVTKTFSLVGPAKKYRAVIGFKVFNLTNHFNPRDFQNNLDSDAFGGFYNGVGRKYGMKFSFVKK